eukprot:3063155-Pyramimonas_sp.AAC.1
MPPSMPPPQKCRDACSHRDERIEFCTSRMRWPRSSTSGHPVHAESGKCHSMDSSCGSAAGLNHSIADL